MNETWDEILKRFLDTDKRDISGYHFPLKTKDLSLNEIKSKIQSGIEKKNLCENEDVESKHDLVYAVETLDYIIQCMITESKKSISYQCEHRYKCRALIVSLAIKRGLNAELSKKDTRFIIVDCY